MWHNKSMRKAGRNEISIEPYSLFICMCVFGRMHVARVPLTRTEYFQSSSLRRLKIPFMSLMAIFMRSLLFFLEFLGYYLLICFIQSWSSFRAVLWDGSRFSLWMKCEIDDYLGILFELLHRFTAILVASFRLFSWCQSARRIFHDSCRIFKILLDRKSVV